VELVQRLLAQYRVCLAMPEISGRRANQLGDFVAVLVFRAIDLDHCLGITQQRFGHRFHRAGFSRSRRPKEEKPAPYRPAGRRHSGEEGLVDSDDLLDGFVLPDNPLAHVIFERFRAAPHPGRIQQHPESGQCLSLLLFWTRGRLFGFFTPVKVLELLRKDV